jgi:hypothetical protein
VRMACRCPGVSADQCPSTHCAASVPDKMSCFGPDVGLAPGTGPMASANAATLPVALRVPVAVSRPVSVPVPVLVGNMAI